MKAPLGYKAPNVGGKPFYMRHICFGSSANFMVGVTIQGGCGAPAHRGLWACPVSSANILSRVHPSWIPITNKQFSHCVNSIYTHAFKRQTKSWCKGRVTAQVLKIGPEEPFVLLLLGCTHARWSELLLGAFDPQRLVWLTSVITAHHFWEWLTWTTCKKCPLSRSVGLVHSGVANCA